MKIFTIVLIMFLSACNTSRMGHSKALELQYPENLNIMKRADWGWQPIDTSFKTHNIEFITVHHGGVEFPVDKDPLEHVKNLQAWSRSEKNWVDIPYHFMISPDGTIFESRPIHIPGDTNTEYNPERHALVEVMGNFEIQEVSKEQYKSMIDIVKFLMIRFNVPVPKVKTHKDYSKMTVCPGRNLYKFFSDGSVAKELMN